MVAVRVQIFDKRTPTLQIMIGRKDGEAISIGMAFAAKISYKKKNITKFEYNKIVDHIKKIGLPHYDKRIHSNKIYNLMQADKKNTDKKIHLVLLKKIGQAYFEKGLDKKRIKKLLK